MCKAGAPTYALPKDFDGKEFRREIMEAKTAVGEAGVEDAQHLLGLVNLCRVLVVAGYVLMVYAAVGQLGLLSVAASVASVLMISLARCVRWTTIGHHISHGGMDKVHTNAPGALPAHFKRGVFAVGARRLIDWLDWVHPEAWNVEHNKLHHYFLSEERDPDLVERNFHSLRAMALPRTMKYASMIFPVFTWKFTYYSPNTFKELALDKKNSWLSRNWPTDRPRSDPMVILDLFVVGPALALLAGRPLELVFWAVFAAQWLGAVAPMLLSVFLPPVAVLIAEACGAWPFAPPASTAALRVLAVALLADALTNAHSFVIIACNHSGEDLYRYATPCKAYSAEFFLRCAHSSANFECGSELIDITYGWLNYQIEHHMFPDMTPLQYRKLQPLVKSVCRKYGVLYIQENALVRTYKMMRVAVGAGSMKVVTALLPPAEPLERGGISEMAIGA